MSEQSFWWERYKLTGSGASEIVAGVEAAVTAGLLAPGESLPPVRELADRLGVNPNTVAAAYRTLRDRGTVETRGRAGTRVRERPGTSARQRPYQLPAGTRDLTLGEPSPELLPRLAPPASVEVSQYWYASAEPALEEQVRRRLARNFAVAAGETRSAKFAGSVGPSGPASPAGPAGSGWHGERAPYEEGTAAGSEAVDSGAAAVGSEFAGSEVAALIMQASLMPVFGSLDGVDRLLATHTRPGDKVAVEDPAWGNLLDLLAARGLTTVPMRVDDEGPQAVGMQAALAAGARVVVVTTRAQNPYGAIVSARRAAMLRSILKAYPDVLTIDDDHGADLTPGVPQVLSGATRKWAYLYSASKAYGPDLRIAALVGDADSVDRVAGQLRHTARRVPGVMQEIWARALGEERHAPVLARATRVYAENRELLIDELARRGVAAHGASGINVWIPVEDEAAAATGLLAQGWAVAPGSWFRVRSGPGVRATIADLRPDEIRQFADAVAQALGVGGGGAEGPARGGRGEPGVRDARGTARRPERARRVESV